MMTRVLPILLLIGLAIRPAAAQQARSQGLAVGGGGGVGWSRPACDYCRRNLDPGPVAWLRVTGPVRPGLELGAEANIWAHDQEVFVIVGALTAVAQIHPTPGGPFFLRTGIGYLTYRAYDDDDDLVANAPAIQFGLGYDFRVSERLALNNAMTLVASRFGTLRGDDRVVVDNLGTTSIQFSVGLVRF
jgi:hypothetical protein